MLSTTPASSSYCRHAVQTLPASSVPDLSCPEVPHPWLLSGGESVKLRTRQSNGQAKTISVINTGDDYVDITISKEAVSVPGRVYCKLRIDDIGAEAFDIIVEPKP